MGNNQELMRNRSSLFFVFLLIIIIALLAYFLGKKSASKTVDNVVMNDVLIKQIAELSALEVQGNASIKSSNIKDDGSVSDNFKKLFMERTFNISVPYVAKYGINLNNQKINIEEKNKQVYIVLPNPKLLSYELLLNRSSAASRKGFFETSDEEAYNKLMQKLYTQSKAQLEANTGYQQQSKEKIRKIIQDYYAPLNFNVEVTFVSDLKSRVVDEQRQ
ncbi:DUF4230 domain-containing protein [Niabella ginsengisoli]|uniref:DUF4230 domain-containing protein n=1 Tax=Niabella ginsengisoli TaxID=522298 RepID=A0ABS9SJY6_9BACT|nr:DUF4230 domain-containing protein [Niabella ginsengisoli]MCH5598693.1 DUF4230 domain-containing protein [Niabella ginsengisoli]